MMTDGNSHVPGPRPGPTGVPDLRDLDPLDLYDLRFALRVLIEHEDYLTPGLAGQLDSLSTDVAEAIVRQEARGEGM